MTKTYDVIVVGGGPGGSACAALLQKRGMKTLLLEQNNTVGGKAMRRSKNGFTYDLWPLIGMPKYGTKFEEVLTELGMELEMSEQLTGMAGGGFMYRPPKKKKYAPFMLLPPGYPEILTEKEQEECGRLFSDMDNLSPLELDALDDISFHDFLSRYNIPQSVYSYLAVLANMLFVVPIDICAASEMMKSLMQMMHGLGPAYPMGAQGQIYETFVKALQRDGGDVRLRTRVERIAVRDGKVEGVYTDKGIFHAPIVVSNAGIQPTVLKLVGEEHFDKSYVSYIKELVPSLSLIGSRYFLDKAVLEDSGYIWFSDNDWWNMERYLKARAGQIPDEMFCMIFIPGGFNPELAPEGKLMIQSATLAPSDPNWQNVKIWLDALDERLAELCPDIRKHTVRRENYTAASVSRLTRDSVVPGQGGECIGLGQIVGQCGRYKPSPKAPIQGLFYVGIDAGGCGVGTHNAVDSATKVAPEVLRYHQTH
ncbi:MAG: NAD(P)/FAD-dependent oxidoreductase [Chloroflexi bacterium]|nr:NAD(P)/FAD-dependent oxidoreductase [Chloroflexota bacterium]